MEGRLLAFIAGDREHDRLGAALGRQSEHVAVERPGERISHRNLLG
jgi:hypothetical protein